MDLDDEEIQNSNWQLVGGKQKTRTHKDATQTPLPESPTQHHPTPTETTQKTPDTTNEGPILDTGADGDTTQK